MTLLLTRGDIAALVRPGDYLEAVEAGFRALAGGGAESPPPMHIHGVDGGFHAKGAAMSLDRPYAAVKLNGNFPGNPDRHGLPTVQGAILLCDAANGTLLAIMDSIEVTLRRTAAATALAARHLARPDSAVVTICGCGAQALPQLQALREVLPIERGFCFDSDPGRAARFASTSGLEVATCLMDAALHSDVIVACTPATAPFLTPDMVRAGAFIAAVGADAPHKSEIAPALMAHAKVVADSLDQCAAMGDLRHAIAAGVMDRSQVHAELAELVAGVKPGRTSADEITLFDSTGVAVQDVASAAVIFRRALAANVGLDIEFGR
ncbi:MAG TPA: ornithine cyclodeaminase family protein [Sphingomicrobium sp.]|nr:ornithine cyclodeaminase family protein [Sphingomicrobium sp.]